MVVSCQEEGDDYNNPSICMCHRESHKILGDNNHNLHMSVIGTEIYKHIDENDDIGDLRITLEIPEYYRTVRKGC